MSLPLTPQSFLTSRTTPSSRLDSLAANRPVGLFAREGTIALALNWPQPMRVATFVQCFGCTFYALNTLGLHKIAVSNSKKSSKKA